MGSIAESDRMFFCTKFYKHFVSTIIDGVVPFTPVLALLIKIPSLFIYIIKEVQVLQPNKLQEEETWMNSWYGYFCELTYFLDEGKPIDIICMYVRKQIDIVVICGCEQLLGIMYGQNLLPTVCILYGTQYTVVLFIP